MIDDKRIIGQRAEEMRLLSDDRRDELISAAENCLDGRNAFEERRAKVILTQSYRKPQASK